MISFKTFLAEVHTIKFFGDELIDDVIDTLVQKRPQNGSDVLFRMQLSTESFNAKLTKYIRKLDPGTTKKILVNFALGPYGNGKFSAFWEPTTTFRITAMIDRENLQAIADLLKLKMFPELERQLLKKILRPLNNIIHHEITHASQEIRWRRGKSNQVANDIRAKRGKTYKRQDTHGWDAYLSQEMEIDAFSNQAASEIMSFVNYDADKAIEELKRGGSKEFHKKTDKDNTLAFFKKRLKAKDISKKTYDSFIQAVAKNLYKRKVQ